MAEHAGLRCTGAVLAGGKSSRMGRDKATLTLGSGRTMLQHTCDALKEVCDRVVVVGGVQCDSTCTIIRDIREHLGPLGGIEAVLASGVDPDGEYLICPCDLPAITPALLRMLLRASSEPASVFHVASRRDPEPLPARINAAALPEVRAMLDRNQLAVRDLMQRVHPQRIEISSDLAPQLHNVNTPADWNSLDH